MNIKNFKNYARTCNENVRSKNNGGMPHFSQRLPKQKKNKTDHRPGTGRVAMRVPKHHDSEGVVIQAGGVGANSLAMQLARSYQGLMR